MDIKIIQEALSVLKAGGLLLYPTDTVWGIGCDAANEKAVEKIYALKQRADSKSLIVLADGISMVERYVQKVPDTAYMLIEVSDKPLTIIYPAATGLASNVAAADGSVAIRIVNHPFCKELLRQFKRPLVSTSANISDEKTPKNFAAISDLIKQGVDYIVPTAMEQGATQKPSSIIKLGLRNEIQIIRE
ncbi:MAG: L-threonylcarbamoyladenylate synthase [Bacteroidales bacterium]|nr:L-threonylcarbamoyladenylate synthase [Bacteroidales bacterium]MCL2133176.1 L-threonylcarbamoyladenylate synthase [Bacteroidales bacterium]